MDYQQHQTYVETMIAELTTELAAAGDLQRPDRPMVEVYQVESLLALLRTYQQVLAGADQVAAKDVRAAQGKIDGWAELCKRQRSEARGA